MTAPHRIILATANARYSHSSLALRYLVANLDSRGHGAQIREFTINERAADIAEAILREQPSVVGLSVYIWNVQLLQEVATLIKQVAPAVTLILGGPEVSFPPDLPPICDAADHIICGEGEIALPALLDDLAGAPRIIAAGVPNLDDLALPYHLYTDHDIAHRVMYVESSRGCAFGCEFCISSLDEKVRHFDEERFMGALQDLWDRGARRFKFIDRTIHMARARRILDFFLDKNSPELFLHFEVVPDHLSDKLIESLARFSPGAVQLEAGVQTFNPQVAERIRRSQKMDKIEESLRTLMHKTGVHLHSDLVLCLPGEDMTSMEAGFNRLLATGVHEIQVGILKRLRGAPIDRHTESFGMVYRQDPPYDVLQTDRIPFMDVQRLKRFSRYFDLVFNSGNFQTTAPIIWQEGSPFLRFLSFSDWLFDTTGKTASIALDRLAGLLFDWLTQVQSNPAEQVANAILADFHRAGRRRFPKCVREFASDPIPAYSPGKQKDHLPARQARHSEDGRE